MDSGLLSKLESARRSLLDMSMRNRLLNFRASRSYSIPITDEKPDEIFRILVHEGKSMTFLPASKKMLEMLGEEGIEETTYMMGQPSEEIGEPAKRHLDLKLQTSLDDKALQTKLLRIFTNARTTIEEQGVNILYLAIGFLQWYESESSSEPKQAPLILIPVELSRDSATSKFKVTYSDEDLETNLSLQEKMKADFGIKIPNVPSDIEGFAPEQYFRKARSAVKQQKRWSVTDKIVLAFFSFGKFLVYLDLDQKRWPTERALLDNPIIRDILTGIFDCNYDLIAETDDVDKHVDIHDCHQVLDADSSQVRAILEVNKGHNVVVQGPPGTGKSQTIANIIAESLARGKRVLFVAEKMAALDVVNRRLSEVGLGDACLELHSHKVRRSAVVQELARTLGQRQPASPEVAGKSAELQSLIEDLTGYAKAVHQPIGANRVSAFKAVGRLETIRTGGFKPKALKLLNPIEWDSRQLSTVIDSAEVLALQSINIGKPSENVWNGVCRSVPMGSELDSLTQDLVSLKNHLECLQNLDSETASYLSLKSPGYPAKTSRLIPYCRHLASVPDGDISKLTSPAWRERLAEIEELLARGQELPLVDYSMLTGLMDAVSGKSDYCIAKLEEPRALFGETGDAEVVDSEALISTLRYLSEAPKAQPSCYISSSWLHQLTAVQNLVSAGRTLSEQATFVYQSIPRDAFFTDTSKLTPILDLGDGEPGVFSLGYKRAVHRLRNLCADKCPTNQKDMIELLRRWRYAQELFSWLESQAALGVEAFGSYWSGASSDWDALGKLTEWMPVTMDKVRSNTLPENALSVLSKVERDRLIAMADELEGALNEFDSSVDALVEFLKLDESTQPRNFAGGQALRREWVEILALYNWLESQAALGVEAFGSYWSGASSDWDALGKLTEWMPVTMDKVRSNTLPENALSVLSKVERDRLIAMADELEGALNEFDSSVDALVEFLKLDELKAVGKPLKTLDYEALSMYLANCFSATDSLHDWTIYRRAVERCEEIGLSDLVKYSEAGFPAEELRRLAEYRYYEAILKEAQKRYPLLRELDRVTHDRKVSRFRKLDIKVLSTARQQLAATVWERMPQKVVGGSAVSQMTLLSREISKKRRHMPLRKLMEEAGDAIQAIKPCFLMSPMSIAKYLSPKSVDFDILIFDEASQVEPHDAIGAIARCKQVVVVGDSKQLPPTSFFKQMSGGDELDTDEESVSDLESILDVCAIVYPTVGLRMHYRSKHESLIAFSNKEFYDSKLVTFPSPYSAGNTGSMRFNYIKNAVYDRGGSRKNLKEAQSVAQRIMEYAQTSPNLSLGVGTFSVAQQEAILDELELLRRDNPEYEEFFALQRHEPFFVKNLENIQGDERDEIFISVGYGPDKNGTLSMFFGPINSGGGWRRLNVLITRARNGIEVFSSIRYFDIDLERTSARGVIALKNYLEYLETGQLDFPTFSDRAIGSEFQEAVGLELSNRGYDVDAEVGVAGFYIDLAVRDPDNPGRYLLGIECDGATYHSARSARERDRLRQDVLENLGWTIYRVWSTDWFNNRAREIEKAIEAIDKAKRSRARAVPMKNDNPSRPSSEDIVRLTKKKPVINNRVDIASKPYRTASISRTAPPRYANPEQTPTDKVAEFIKRIVDCEGPIHREELNRRASQLWGFKRVAKSVTEAIDLGLKYAIANKTIEKKRSFLWPKGMEEPPIRDRSFDDVPKKAYLIPPEEINLLAKKLEEVHVGISREHLIVEVAHALGMRRAGPEITDYIKKCLKK